MMMTALHSAKVILVLDLPKYNLKKLKTVCLAYDLNKSLLEFIVIYFLAFQYVRFNNILVLLY